METDEIKTESKANVAVATIVDRMFRYVMTGCLTAHIILLIAFIYHGIKLFAILNICSVLLYTVLYIKKFHLTPNVHFLALNLEILIHMGLAVIFFGWNYGFQYYFIFLFTAIFMKVLNNIKFIQLYGVMQAVVYIILRIITFNMEPIYPKADEAVVRMIYLINICIFFIGAYVLANTVNHSNLLYRAMLSKDNEELKEQAQEDYLTGLSNRRSLYNQFDYLERSSNENFTYCVAIGDIDDFKLINDKWGHEIGDAILVSMSDIIRNMVREKDIVCRWGGEEIVIVMPNMPRNLAYERIEGIRKKIETVSVEGKSGKIYATMTFGVCGNYGETDLERVVAKADELLYIGKKNGKNQVVQDQKIV
ncbi:MAG: diguanylate cyclase [bacterium]|nr:diguanylate cyclase [bacterium]